MKNIELNADLFTDDIIEVGTNDDGSCYIGIYDADNGLTNSVYLENEKRIKIIKALGGIL